MGCVASRIDREEKVRICKERKRLMRQLVGFRREFAEAQLIYLTALKNTGVTLRQFTESDSLDLDADTMFGRGPPFSPPPTLPPSPPPPPTFSPDLQKCQDNQKLEETQEDIIELDEDDTCTPPPPPLPSNSWDFWDPFGTSLPKCLKERETLNHVEEENWVDTNSEFQDDNQEEEVVPGIVVKLLPEKLEPLELVDDTSSMMSWHTKDTTDMAMVVWRSKKTLATMVKELDDYFLKASACGKDVGVLMDINAHYKLLGQSINENQRNKSSSAKVFSALTWSWSSKSLQSTRDIVMSSGPSDPCRPGSHSITLEKLYAQEQKLYNEVKEEEITKLEHERKSFLLQKQENEDQDWTKNEKTRTIVESLQSDLLSVQQSISRTCSSILNIINDELQPQLTALTSGLMHMWHVMYQCHQVQNHISQQANHLAVQQIADPTTDYHRQAAAQLKQEVTSWCNSFCNLIKFQRDYVKALSRWIELTDCLADDCQRTSSSSAVYALCRKWQLGLDRLPDKAAGEAIKSLLSAINSLVLQQGEEKKLQKRYHKLEKKLQRELNSLAEMEVKFEPSIATEEDAQSVLTTRHPLALKRAKVEAMKKQVDEEKAKYHNLVEVTRAMTLNNLQTSLPNVFRALMEFSGAYSKALEVAK